jgi:hypothetical protein
MMILVAGCALLLMPLIWVARQRQMLVQAELRAAEAAMIARDQAAAIQARLQAQLAESPEGSGAGTSSAGTAPASARTAAAPAGKVWASLSMNHAVFKQDEVKDLLIEFSLVNDGSTPIDPGISHSRLIVNGQEAAGSILAEAEDPRYRSLAVGDRLQFTRKLGDMFRSPGTYRLSWRGESFQSRELTLRVLPVQGR